LKSLFDLNTVIMNLGIRKNLVEKFASSIMGYVKDNGASDAAILLGSILK